MEVINLWIVVGVEGKACYIAESKVDVARGFGVVKRVTKGLVVRKS